MRAPQAGSLNPLQSEAVVLTSLNQRSAVRLGPSLNPLQSEAVVFGFHQTINTIPWERFLKS